MEPKQRSQSGVVETIIILQSILLLCFGLAGFTSSATIVAGFRAMTNPVSHAYFVTDGKVMTEFEEIGTDGAEAVINNFQLVCVTSLTIGAVVLAASLVRLAKKSRSKKS